ncbi:UDP-glucuronate:xylan alpha-glucuronosyltransferase 1 [Apostasia shenzhenica]|uniref:UDP-glucuronate:xylan alpha-glucuronosyltransferase 1 n=1 Tax=Apostasia shenzhenica TaxID=1088818 RepID=A0A2I0AI21_9ASPA|nr:UDP-glucuronate:xylan alpha-glucuronosyltransferase 1 [Apostasia shenzhenica]
MLTGYSYIIAVKIDEERRLKAINQLIIQASREEIRDAVFSLANTKMSGIDDIIGLRMFPGLKQMEEASRRQIDEMSKRRNQRSRDFKVDKAKGPMLERTTFCKFRIIDVGWMWERPVSDYRYSSDVNVNWTQISSAIARMNGRRKNFKVGLLNFNISEVNFWQQLLPRADSFVLHQNYADINLAWEDLYPEWIDEEEENEVPSCPSLPDPEVIRGTQFDLIAVKLPCNRTMKNWSRDVARVHLQLSAAKLAAQSGANHFQRHVLLVTDCYPIPNLFHCRNLVAREGNAWLYKPDPIILGEKLQLPVGSCKLSVPLKADVFNLRLVLCRSLPLSHVPTLPLHSDVLPLIVPAWSPRLPTPAPTLALLDCKITLQRLTLATPSRGVGYPQTTLGCNVLHWKSQSPDSSNRIAERCDILRAFFGAQSIRLTGSTRDLVILVDEAITSHHCEGLEAAGWKVRAIQRIRNPRAEQDAYNEWNYSKFRLWQLTDYDKVIFIDADLLILRNIDFLFTMPEITAIGNNATLFNSGVMVIEPSNCTFQLLMDHINEIESYNGGDQGYLNEIFTWWHRIPKHMNFLKHFWEGDPQEIKEKKIQYFKARPPVLYVLHFLGLKPWLCFRDYDCNWNVDILQEFASDEAHSTWWRVHDSMTKGLQSYCLLRSKQKAALEWDRRQAEKANYPDGHWKINITDPRRDTCFEEFCFWESMLWHWGEKNWTDNSSLAIKSSNPAAILPG